MSESTDPYTYPGTDVLRNLRGVRDFALLERFEAQATTRRLIELIHAPNVGSFDVAHLKAIHQHIFRDVYAWAGQLRTVEIAKAGQPFGAVAFLESSLHDLLLKLQQEYWLRGMDGQSFAARAGFFLAEINAVHPFREGNGRTQREFMRQLGLGAGFKIDWSRVSREQMTEASRSSLKTGNSSGMAELISAAMGNT